MARLRGRVDGSLVLDAEGVVKFADGDPRTLERLRYFWQRNGGVVTAAPALAEVLRGAPRDAKVHRVLSRITEEAGRPRGERIAVIRV